MVMPKGQLQAFVKDTLLNVRNGLQEAVNDGFVILWPDVIRFSVNVVADGDVVAVVGSQKASPDAAQTTTTITEAETETTVRSSSQKATEASSQTGRADESQSDTANDSVAETVDQTQGFGRSSTTQVTYLRS